MANFMLIDLKVREIEQFIADDFREKNELLAIRPKI